MEIPTIPHTVKDERNNITYTFYAYRQMTKTEVLRHLAVLLRSKKRPKKNSRVEAYLTVGNRPNN